MEPRRSSDSSSPDYDESLEFFKVFLPSFSSHQLRIPPDFVKQIKVKLPNKATLEDHTGQSWSVHLIESGSKLFIKNGWEEFATDHSLGFGDFLVFSYHHSSSVFHVKIFGKNGCKKEWSPCPANKPPVGIKIAQKEHVEERVEETSAAGRANRPIRNCKRKYADLDINKLHSSSPYEDLPKRSRRATPHEDTHENRPEKQYIPKHPHFVACITSSTSKVMSIPRTFLEDHHIKMEPTVKLQDQNGKLWRSRILFTTQERTGFSSGWSDFCFKNLRLNERCMFEFVLGEGNICSEVIVRALHTGVETEKSSFYRVMKV